VHDTDNLPSLFMAFPGKHEAQSIQFTPNLAAVFKGPSTYYI